MDVQIGANNQIFIKQIIIDKIRCSLGKYNYETGGIIGLSNNTIVEFEFDAYSPHEQYEYYPTTDFFEEIINKEWRSKNISFIGIVHSHKHNNRISVQDISYCREIIKANDEIEELIIGVLDLSDEDHRLKWFSVNLLSAEETDIVCVQ